MPPHAEQTKAQVVFFKKVIEDVEIRGKRVKFISPAILKNPDAATDAATTSAVAATAADSATTSTGKSSADEFSMTTWKFGAIPTAFTTYYDYHTEPPDQKFVRTHLLKRYQKNDVSVRMENALRKGSDVDEVYIVLHGHEAALDQLHRHGHWHNTGLVPIIDTQLIADHFFSTEQITLKETLLRLGKQEYAAQTDEPMEAECTGTYSFCVLAGALFHLGLRVRDVPFSVAETAFDAPKVADWLYGRGNKPSSMPATQQKGMVDGANEPEEKEVENNDNMATSEKKRHWWKRLGRFGQRRH